MEKQNMNPTPDALVYQTARLVWNSSGKMLKHFLTATVIITVIVELLYLSFIVNAVIKRNVNINLYDSGNVSLYLIENTSHSLEKMTVDFYSMLNSSNQSDITYYKDDIIKLGKEIADYLRSYEQLNLSFNQEDPIIGALIADFNSLQSHMQKSFINTNKPVENTKAEFTDYLDSVQMSMDTLMKLKKDQMASAAFNKNNYESHLPLLIQLSVIGILFILFAFYEIKKTSAEMYTNEKTSSDASYLLPIENPSQRGNFLVRLELDKILKSFSEFAALLRKQIKRTEQLLNEMTENTAENPEQTPPASETGSLHIPNNIKTDSVLTSSLPPLIIDINDKEFGKY